MCEQGRLSEQLDGLEAIQQTRSFLAYAAEDQIQNTIVQLLETGEADFWGEGATSQGSAKGWWRIITSRNPAPTDSFYLMSISQTHQCQCIHFRTFWRVESSCLPAIPSCSGRLPPVRLFEP